ncbi:MAG: hypothetical protein BGO26_06315 [Actinobacteria bacterium 69-20]|nr:C40 family peptidase [Actinomycetota bacterium]OJV28061.1 MAG: hypothetical protein BGO26_06315 [Actinobacteria bacterium 69-20]
MMVAVALGLANPVPVAAAPPAPDADGTNEPTTSTEAQKAWLDSSEKAALVNDEVLQAQEQQRQARDGADRAARTVGQAEQTAAAAAEESGRAAMEAAELQSQAREFASAAFRGAQLSTVSALLTSDSAYDFLDQAQMLDQVATTTQATLDAAAAAERAAREAEDAAADAAARARAAKRAADAAAAAADRATVEVQHRQAALRDQAAQYRALTRQLTQDERNQAIAAQQRAYEQQAAATAEPAVPAPPPQQQSAGASPAGQVAVAAALSKLGARYVWGASGPNLFDCSGLTSWAWAQAGVSIPRTSRDQSTMTTVPLDQLRPGDLVTYYSPVSHVAMYIGNGKVVQASTESMPVYISSLYGAGPNPTGHRVNG